MVSDEVGEHGTQPVDTDTLLHCNGVCHQEVEEPSNKQPKTGEETQSLEDPNDAPLLPAPLDGGWGWVILAASFVCAAAVEGTITLFGVILPHLLDHYGESRAKTTVAGSMMIGGFLMSGW